MGFGRPLQAGFVHRLFHAGLGLLTVFGLLVGGTRAHSQERNALRSLFRVDEAVLHTATHRVHALSHFQISLTLHQLDSDQRLPVRLRLRPDSDTIAEGAAIHHHNADGSVTVEPIRRLDHRLFQGDVFVPSQGVAAATNHWTNAGWASIYVHVDGVHPVFEGAFRVFGDHHHIQTSANYLDTRIWGDPLIPTGADAGADAGDYMVVWRDSDIMAPGAETQAAGDELRRRLRRQHSANGIVEELPQPACSSDELLFNMDEMHPVHRGGSKVEVPSSASASSDVRSWLFGRQIDGTGSTGGNSAGVNLTSTIGSSSGCPTTRKVALMGIAADCTYMQAFPSRDNATAHIVQQISSASKVYESTFNVSLAIKSLVLQSDTCPSSPSSSVTPWNAGCSSNLTISDRLNLFSQWRGTNNDTNAFWMLLSTCATDSAVGLAWLGQLCVLGAETSASSDGSGNETVAATNVVVRTSTEWQVMAHETGHTFGAVHDCTSSTCADGTATKQLCCPLSASTCDAAAGYIMNPSTGSGITQFSPCTKGNVCAALGRNSVNGTCLSDNRGVVSVTGSVCGNGIVEEGEDCDCGGTSGCGSDSACCNPETCHFATGALCDPANDECCTSACQMASAGVQFQLQLRLAGLCSAGQCTSRDLQCQTLMGSLASSGNDTYACSDQGCTLSCASPAFGSNTCFEMMQNFLDGTSCEGGGRCSNGVCKGSSVTKEIASTLRHNLTIVIPVACVVGVLILAALLSCICSFCRRRRNRRLRRRMRNGLPPSSAAAMPMTAAATWGRNQHGNRAQPPKPGNMAMAMPPAQWQQQQQQSGPSRWSLWGGNSNRNDRSFPQADPVAGTYAAGTQMPPPPPYSQQQSQWGPPPQGPGMRFG
ncbi:metalloprotease [Grosmannia clavigera kw1407]|uniref:Metalloprotease n=1 Tax=Grosmannia clavigera (strain kw1407 / UAMH 11150) TaxID=655863 RepID=F0XTX1_GROCL|nr:metalloprotease [Grosmannia clavigera kw1407]EFW98987.1 metalloprotease [Grosmannia clavigera kw1407]